MAAEYMKHKILWLLWLIVATLFSATCFAAYVVDIKAPQEIKPLLESYLQINNATNKQTADEELLQYMINLVPFEVNNLLATQGYFSSTAQTQRNEQTNIVSIIVDPGPKTRVNSFQLDLKGAIKQDNAFSQYRDNLYEAWPLYPNRVFTQTLWDEGKIKGLLAISREKYARARITYSQAKINPAKQSADLSVVYDSGPEYHIGEISIKGLKHYPEGLVRNQIAMQPGESYSQEKLLNIQSTLQNFPHFVSAIVEPDFMHEKVIDTDHVIAPLVVTVQEAPLQKINFGVGYSTDRGTRGEIQYQYNNIARRGWVLAVKAKKDRLEREGGVVLTVPKRGSGYDDSFYVRYKKSNIEGLITDARSIGAQRIRKRGLIETALLLEHTKEELTFNDGSIEKPQALALGYKWIRRDLDDIANPRSGNMLWLEVGGAAKKVLSDTSFINVHGTGVVYWKLGKKNTLISRLEVGQVFAGNTLRIPSRWLFRAGGSNSVRGYKYDSLGVSRGGSIADGRVIATGTLELQRTVYNEWRAAVFVDAGDAAKNWQTYRLHTGAGLGARWASQVGVFGADFAYGFQEKRWHFYVSMGLMF